MELQFLSNFETHIWANIWWIIAILWPYMVWFGGFMAMWCPVLINLPWKKYQEQATGPPRSGAGVGVGMLRGAGDSLTWKMLDDSYHRKIPLFFGKPLEKAIVLDPREFTHSKYSIVFQKYVWLSGIYLCFNIFRFPKLIKILPSQNSVFCEHVGRRRLFWTHWNLKQQMKRNCHLLMSGCSQHLWKFWFLRCWDM